MTLFVAGLLVFLGIHSISIVAPRWRDAQAARMGENAWKGLYAVASIVSLVAMIYGYGIARQLPVMVYAPSMALRHLSFLLMLPVFPLLIAAYLPGRIKRLARNPMLLAVILWAVSHLLANGTLNDLLLFGAFLVWAVADLISVSRRPNVRPVPSAPASAINDVIVVVAGLGLYAFVLLWAHARVVGVSPLG
jgi:uncharacterized membrane protein